MATNANSKEIGKVVKFDELDSSTQELVKKSVAAAQFSYSPYSNFKVGAALKCENGTIFTGCNVENCAYTPAICAERTAVSKAVSEGQKSFTEIAISASDPEKFTSPCGVCRQVLIEFGDDIKIYLTKFKMDTILCTSIEELLPMGFSPRSNNIPKH